MDHHKDDGAALRNRSLCIFLDLDKEEGKPWGGECLELNDPILQSLHKGYLLVSGLPSVSQRQHSQDPLLV